MNTTYLVVALGLLVFSLAMLRYALNNYSKANASNNWETTTGKLTKLQLWGKRRVDGEMVDSENVSIKYQYDINGKTFTGSRTAFYTLHYPETVDFAKRYPQGSTVPVFYNPQNPVESVIVPGLHPQKPNGEIWLASIVIAVSLAVIVGIFTGEFK